MPLTLEIPEKILIFYIELSKSVYRFFLDGVGFIKRFILPQRPSSKNRLKMNITE